MIVHRAALRARLSLLAVLLVTLALLAACGVGSPSAGTAAEEAATEAPASEEAASEEAAASEATTDTEAAASEASTDTEAAASTSDAVAATATPIPPGTRAGDLEPADRVGMFATAPEMTIDPEAIYYATFKVEDKGDIKVQLFADRTPVTVNNFIFLAREGYYDNTVFHRVLEGFMAQGGDPSGTGSGGPGYMFEDEIVDGLGFDRPGLLAMANAGAGTNGSQFFLTFAATEWLNGAHTIFGEVIEGIDVLNSLTLRDPETATDFAGDVLTTVEIEESDESVLPTPTPAPPTPTPFAPSALDATERPLADMAPADRVSYFSAAPEMTIEEGVTYTATIELERGNLTVALDAVNAPLAVNNFVTLANLGFYDGTPINRVSAGELMIIGSPDNNLELPTDAGYMFIPEVGLPTTPITGSIAFAPMVPSAEGIMTSGSILMIALAPPPAESATDYGFFATVVNSDEVLLAIVEGDIIERITISSDE